VENADIAAPNGLVLSFNSLNPGRIVYRAPGKGRVRLEIFSINGKRLGILADGNAGEGIRSVQWNPAGKASGVCIIRLTAGKKLLVKKAILMN